MVEEEEEEEEVVVVVGEVVEVTEEGEVGKRNG